MHSIRKTAISPKLTYSWKSRLLFASVASPSKAVSQNLFVTKTPLEVATRLVSTQFLVTRWAIEMQELKEREDASTANTRATTYKPSDAFESLRKCLEGWDQKWTDRERAVMNAPLGKWQVENDLYLLDMRWECLGMLLWTAKILKSVPSTDSLFDRQQIYSASAIIPAIPSTVTTFLDYFGKGAGMNPEHSISQPADFLHKVNTAEAWLWRARAQKVKDLKTHFTTPLSDETEDELRKDQFKQIPRALKNVMDHIEDAIELGATRAKEEGYILETTGNDFAAFGKKYGDCDDHQIRDLHRTAEARVNCLGWLAGKNVWDYEEGGVNFINPTGSLWAPEESEA